MNPHSYAHVIYDKVAKKYDGEKQPLQQMFLGRVVSVCRKLKLDTCLAPCTIINSKWTKGP
jgi:hypothetical protein